MKMGTLLTKSMFRLRQQQAPRVHLTVLQSPMDQVEPFMSIDSLLRLSLGKLPRARRFLLRDTVVTVS